MDLIKIPWDRLSGIYRFQNTPFVSYQDKDVCEVYVRFICDCLDKVLSDKPDMLFKNESKVEVLLKKTKNSLLNSDNSINWMPEYGCVWILHDYHAHLVDKVSINVIGLDQHHYFMQGTGSKKHYKHSGEANIHESILSHVGLIDKEKIPGFIQTFQSNLSITSSRKQSERSAAGGKQGHQKTPSFVHAILKQTLCNFNDQRNNLEQQPKGGFTDVGLHTGGSPRNTSWPLACSLLHFYLKQHKDDFVDNFLVLRVVMTYLDIYILESSLANDNYKKLPGKIDAVCSIMHSAVKKLGQFVCERLDVTSTYQRVAKNEEKLRDIISKQEKEETERYILPNIEESYINKYKVTNLHIKLPIHEEKLQSTTTEQEKEDRSNKNLDLVPLFCGSNLEELWEWLELVKKPQYQRTEILKLQTVETLLWEYSTRLNGSPLTEPEVNTLIKVVDYYRDVMHKFQSLQEYRQLMAVEVKSREVLVVWVAYCLIFQSVNNIYDGIMQEYGICLNFQDLSHLVLRSKHSIDTVQRVAQFLEGNQTGNPLFSLNNDSPTFDLALKYGNKYLGDILSKEKSDASLREEKHWKEVVRKQKLVAQYREELQQLKREKSDAEYELTRAKNRYNALPSHRRTYTDEYYEMTRCQSKDSTIHSNIVSKERQIKNELQAPSPVIQPIPKESSKALKVLFFLYMPEIFRHLSRVSMTAAQVLLPTMESVEIMEANGTSFKCDIYKEIQVRRCNNSWKDFYNQHQRCAYHNPTEIRSGEEGDLLLRMQNYQIPQQIGPRTVDGYYSQSDGIWYPDSLLPRLAWGGGPKAYDRKGAGEFNPFDGRKEWYVSCFTEQLRAEERNSLQWALIQSGLDNLSRGNRTIASQKNKPKWLLKPEYLWFGKIRAFPHVQLRNIMIAIADRCLPLSSFSVQTLLRQTIYQIGNISVSDGKAEFQWKQDMNDGDFVVSFKQIMTEFVDEIGASPYKYKEAQLAAEISNFFSEWWIEFKDISRSVAYAVRKWGDDCEQEIQNAVPSDIPILRARQSLFYNIAVFALLSGVASSSDVEIALELTAKAKNLFVDDKNDFKDDLDNIAVLCKRAIEEKTPFILQAIQSVLVSVPGSNSSCKNNILSSILRAVLPICQDDMKWEPWRAAAERYPNCCFFSRVYTSEGPVMYSINVLSGIILVDGLPPHNLPLQILDHPLYKRTFGDINFEVVHKNGILETVRPIKQSYYQFGIMGNTLKVREISANLELELLDGSNLQEWAGTLPKRLQELHGHWVNRKNGVIFLQGKKYEDRCVDFILVFHGTNMDEVVECKCKRVPLHMRSYDRVELVKHHSSFQQLVLHESPVIDILAKFENKTFIHTYIKEYTGTNKKEVMFHLPRFDIGFEVRGTEILCQEIVNHKLCYEQQLLHTMKGFTSYLVLEGGRKITAGSKIILVPDGTITLHPNGLVRVDPNETPGADREWFKYQVHPRFYHITAAQIAARIRLATLHIATSTLLPENKMNMTGEERAIELLRQCWTNRPFSQKEKCELENLKCIGHGMSSVVSLLCVDLENSSQQLGFLFDPTESRKFSNTDCDEASAYLNFVQRNDYGYRRKLTRDEEWRIIGSLSDSNSSILRFSRAYHGENCPVDNEYLVMIQSTLDQGLKKKMDVSKKVFPLTHIQTKNSLEDSILNELCSSYAAYQDSKNDLFVSLHQETLLSILSDLMNKKELLQNHVLNCLHWSPDPSKDPLGQEVKLLRLANYYPTVALSDFPVLACRTNKMLHYNPFLSTRGIKNVKTAILRWLQCCVMEDKLNRLIENCSNPDRQVDFKKELENQRNWADEPSPHWLAFEVEGRIQIRPEQYAIANHLIQNQGHIVQLNMGMGKSRVILPMLLLHWHFGQRDKVVRLHVLSALYSEAYEFIHFTCCASVLSIKLYMLPFCRENELDEHRIRVIRSVINYCQMEGGAFIIEPEHRLSLELKWKTMQLENNNFANDLQKIIHESPWYNILDESDEILHHRFQLIYAHGGAMFLPQGPHRYKTAQALLEVISKEKISILVKNKEEKSVSFPSFVISAEVKIDSSTLSAFRKQIVGAMLKNLPYSLKWMNRHPFIDRILSYITERKYDIEHTYFPQEHLYDILALRGLLAGDLLFHCLVKRHRVDYGIFRNGKKRIAVPFRGADTPSLRSEFAHPDCAIVLTMLAYYSDGLSREELEEAFEKLFSLGINERRHFYSLWFELNSNYLAPEVKSYIDKVEKIDLSNVYQMGILWEYFGKNPRTIDFWLNTCVFPSELQQYPHRLTATAWHLTNVECGSTVGFSGTNDNHRILPLQVKQYFSKENNRIWRQIEGTNGKMVDLILQTTLQCKQLGSGLPRNELLSFIKMNIKSIHAIIDCGALLAGMENIDAAKSIMKFVSDDVFKGVTFFHNNKNQWMILEHSGRLLEKSLSPVHERDTFVIFDEARCRGADMKLKPDAVAALSIGPSICKDKLMQGAGRMRQLGDNQKLIIVGIENVFKKIKDMTLGTNAINVLEWTMKNTFEATRKGIPNWANQGMHFSTSENNVQHYLIDEKMTLEDFYGKSFESKTVLNFVKSLIQNMFEHVGGSTELSASMASKITERAELLKNDEHVSLDGVDEECEREIEIEQEQEEEVEREIPLMTPRDETNWKWEKIMHVSCPFDLPINMYSLESFVRKYLSPENLSSILFSNNVHLSENFAKSITNQITYFNDFLRIVDTAVIFPSKECLLISERESDFIVREFWNHQSLVDAKKAPILIHFSMLRRASDINEPVRLALYSSKQTPANWSFTKAFTRSGLLTVEKMKVDENQISSIQLFAGETTYKTNRRQEALQSMLKAAVDSNFALSVDPREFAYMRGYLHHVEYSDLESNWKEVIRWASCILLKKKEEEKKEKE